MRRSGTSLGSFRSVDTRRHVVYRALLRRSARREFSHASRCPWLRLRYHMIIALALTLITVSHQEVPAKRISKPAVFASGDHQAWPVPDTGWVEEALFLSDGRIAVLDGASQRTYFVNPVDGVSTAAGGSDYDPAEVTKLLGPLPDGGLVTIDVDHKLVGFRADASVDFTTQLALNAFDDAIGLFADGTLVVRRTVRSPAVVNLMQPAAVDTVFRRSLEFSRLLSTQRTTIAETASGELASVTVSTASSHSSRTYRPIFGHRTMADVSRETLVVAQTDLYHVTVYDMGGTVVGRIPLQEPTAGCPDACRRKRTEADTSC